MSVARLVRTALSKSSRLAVAAPRSLPARPVARAFATSETPATTDDEVVRCSCIASDARQVVPELVETLEWVLDSPPPIHQFEEPPIIVEIAGIEPAGSRS